MSKEATTEYQKICEEIFGTELSLDQAEAEAARMLRLFQIICMPTEKIMRILRCEEKDEYRK